MQRAECIMRSVWNCSVPCTEEHRADCCVVNRVAVCSVQKLRYALYRVRSVCRLQHHKLCRLFLIILSADNIGKVRPLFTTKPLMLKSASAPLMHDDGTYCLPCSFIEVNTWNHWSGPLV